jgi:hypothetical protein
MVLKDDNDYQDVEEDDKALYEIALNHRNRLIEYDINSA